MTHWKFTPQGQGILVAADEKIEWLLPWWWKRYSSCNHLPVAFVDLGMSHYGRTFCSERGRVIELEDAAVLSGLANHSAQGDKLFGKEHFKSSQKSWFKKPFALLATPFKRTLWLYLDCEVLRPLDELFELNEGIYLAKETENSISRERALAIITGDQPLYNSGVILYSHGDVLIEKWAAEHSQEAQFFSDQHILSKLIYTNSLSVKLLHENYNWRMSQGLNLNAVIVHWVSSWGKEYIRLHGGIAEELDVLLG